MCTGKYIECSKVTEDRPRKPRTKREQTVMALREKLPALTDRQRRWMMTEPYKERNVAYYWKRGRVWCQHCGHVEQKGITVETASLLVTTGALVYVCPHCGKTMELEPYNQGWHGYRCEGKYCTLVTTIKDYTVLRTFESFRLNRLGQPTHQDVLECWQSWICPDGKEVILAVPHYSSMWTGTTWHFHGEWAPKKLPRYLWNYTVFDECGNFFYPIWNVSKLLRRNGWTKAVLSEDIRPATQMKNILGTHVGEMLVKNGHIALFNYWCKRGANDMERYLPSVHICNRNRYQITDASLWLDYIDLLMYFGKDVHNAHYVCPQDIRTEHDRLTKKKARIEQRKELAEAARQTARKEKGYKKLHGAFFGVSFTGDDIAVHVVSSVKEMAEEGIMMHHCVYQNEYYKRPDSLILSARDLNGNRLETVEISLRTWSILQSRGKYNNPTERHQDIINLVNKNMNKLKKIAV